MTALTIHSIETKPELDPYHRDTGQATRTYIKLDPRDHTLWVCQEHDDNSTPSEEWHGLVLTWRVYNWPTEEELRAWLDEHMDLFDIVAAGWERFWDGSNHVGRLSEAADRAVEQLTRLLDQGIDAPGYEFWSAADWLYEDCRDRITATTTDAELEAMAAEAELVAAGDNVILDEPALEWMKRARAAA